MAIHAGINDVETALLRPLAPVELDLAASLLRLAANRLRSLIADLDSRMDLEPDYGFQVRYVEAQAVKRVIENPQGMTQESIGPFSGSRSAGDNPGTLEFTQQELRSLGVGREAFTIRPHLDTSYTVSVPPELQGWIT